MTNFSYKPIDYNRVFIYNGARFNQVSQYLCKNLFLHLITGLSKVVKRTLPKEIE